MTVLDILITMFPTLFAVPFFFFGGLKRLIVQLGNPDMAIGLFGAIICLSSVLVFAVALSPSAKVMFENYSMFLGIVGIGNLLLFLWELAQTRLGNR
jgi:hypothetical protein